MEKPDNSFAILKSSKTHLKKNILSKGSASLLKNSVWDSFQFLLVQINLLVSPGKLTPNGLFQTISGLKNITGLHQTTPSTKT